MQETKRHSIVREAPPPAPPEGASKACRRIVICGCAGRMGQALIRQILARDGGFAEKLRLIGGIETDGHPSIGTDMGRLVGLDEIGVVIGATHPVELIAKADGLIEFSTPRASVEHAALAAQGRIVHIIGATGFDAEQQGRIRAAARHATIVQSANMSLGLSMLAELARIAAARLGEEWDAEIMDTHHRHKLDSPSGSALMLAQAVAQARAWNLDDVLQFDRSQERQQRPRAAIGMASRRGGSVIGAHEVLFAGAGEEITLAHRAEDRAIYARGALRAFLWAQGKLPGLYNMRDVLGFAE